MIKNEFVGYGSISNLERLLRIYHPKRVFLVTGRKSYNEHISEYLSDVLSNFNFSRFCDFETNPKLSDIERGIQMMNSREHDIVVCVGGGSVIDAAKTINVLAANKRSSKDYVSGKSKIQNKGKTLIAIPTTSGSGSEATVFSVVYMGKEKYSLEHKFIFPDYSIIDPVLTEKLPKDITAVSGMDALSQAIESYWSVNSTNESKKYAREAIKLIVRSLNGAVNHPNLENRLDMAKGAHLAGKAINISKTTAPHAISYAMTSHFGIPHGHAVALTLGDVLVHNAGIAHDDYADKRGSNYVKKTLNEICTFLDSKDESAAKRKINALMSSIGLKTRLSQFGISTRAIRKIANKVNNQRLKNNPRLITKQDIIGFLNH